MDIFGQMFWAYFSKVAVYGFLIFAIFCSKNCSKEWFFYFCNLQVEHEDGEQGYCEEEPVEEGQQDSDVYEIEAEECGIAADLVDAICDEFGFICMGDASAPVIFHGQYGDDKSKVSESSKKQTADSYGGKREKGIVVNADEFSSQNGKGCCFHGQFDCFFSSFFAFSHLVSLDSLLSL